MITLRHKKYISQVAVQNKNKGKFLGMLYGEEIYDNKEGRKKLIASFYKGKKTFISTGIVPTFKIGDLKFKLTK